MKDSFSNNLVDHDSFNKQALAKTMSSQFQFLEEQLYI